MTGREVPRLKLRDRRRQQTAAEIEQAAITLFEREGYAGTTIEHIAEVAGIAPRTFFRYFPVKEAVLFRDHTEKVEEFRHALAAIPPSVPPVERIRQAMWQAQRPQGDSNVVQARMKLMTEVPDLRAYHASLVEAYETAAAEALLPPAADKQSTIEAYAIAGAVFGALRALTRIEHREDSPPEADLFHHAFAVLGRMDAESALE